MNLNKIIVVFFLIIAALNSQAQKSVYIISYEDKWGLTDSIGTEIVEPIYDRYEIAKNGEIYLFSSHYGLSRTSLLYTVETGELNNKYKFVYLDNVMIDEQSYHYFSDGKNPFLQNSETGELFKSDQNTQSIKNLGSSYLMAKFRPTKNEFKPRLPPSKGSSNSEPKMQGVPSVDFDLYTYAIYSNKLPLKAELKIDAHSYLMLYEKETENNERVLLTKPLNSADFDYLVFRKDEQLFLYDKNIKLLKKLTYPKTEEKDQIDEKYVQTEVSKSLGMQTVHSQSIYPDAAADPSYTEKEKNYAFEVKKTTDGQNLLIRKSDEKLCFSTPFRMEYGGKSNSVWITNSSRGSSYFKIDKETGKPFLPQKYMDILEIKCD